MKDKVLEELRFSTGIVLGGEEVVPRFRVICHDGDWTIFVPLPDDIGERQRRMQLVYGFMAWKSAVAFVISSELQVPDVVISAGVGRDEVVVAARPILRRPLIAEVTFRGQKRGPPSTVDMSTRALVGLHCKGRL